MADITYKTFYACLVNSLVVSDNNKHCMHEKISIEIQVWPLTGLFLLPYRFFHLSYAYASSKNRIGKFGRAWFILKSLR